MSTRLAGSIVAATVVCSSAGAQEFRPYEFDLSRYNDTERLVLEKMINVVVDSCPALVSQRNFMSADRVEVYTYDGGYEVEYAGSQKPWQTGYWFYFTAKDTPPDLFPRWAGHRFAVQVSLDPMELTAQKRIGHQVCSLPRIADQHNGVRQIEDSELAALSDLAPR